MDQERCHAYPRTFAAVSSRRATLRTLAASTLAAGLNWLGLPVAMAKCVKPGKKCREKHGGTKGCRGGSRRQGGKNARCKCWPGSTACDGRCVDLSLDELHCGQCGNACPAGKICFNAQCCSDVFCFPPGQNCVCV